MSEELIEALAAYVHEAWSVWMKYLFSACDGAPIVQAMPSAVIPAWAVERWQRQMNTAYVDLPEAEKESDRKEARRILEIFDITTGA